MATASLLGNPLQGLCPLSLAVPRLPQGSPSQLYPSLPPRLLTGSLAGAAWVSLGSRPLPAASVSLWLCLLSPNQGKFREQFKAAFSCCLPGPGPCGSLKAPSPRSSASHKSLSLQSRCSVSKLSEHVVLTSVTTVLP